MQMNMIGHAHLTFMLSVWDQNICKIAITDRSTWYILQWLSLCQCVCVYRVGQIAIQNQANTLLEP